MILQKILRIDFYSFYFDTSILYRTFARSFFACMEFIKPTMPHYKNNKA